MSHARLGATALGTLTLAVTISLPSIVVAQGPAAPTPPPATTTPPSPKPAPAATPAATPPAAPAPAPEAAAPATPAPAEPAAPSGAEPPEDEDEAPPDSDASPQAPTTKPSPAMLFIRSRKERATPAEEAPPKDDGLMGSHQDHFHLSAGMRVSFVPNEGYDLFSKDNDLTQLSLAFGRTVLAIGDTSLDASIIYDWGPSESKVRSADTSLDVHRVSLGLEGRYHLFRRLYVFGRLAPGALRWDADITDGGADVQRTAGDWTFSADLGAGAAYEIIGEARGLSKLARGFVLADAGYGWTTSSALEFLPADGQRPPARLEPLDLGELAFRGGYFRVALALTY
jgi:hypothetical protein